MAHSKLFGQQAAGSTQQAVCVKLRTPAGSKQRAVGNIGTVTSRSQQPEAANKGNKAGKKRGKRDASLAAARGRSFSLIYRYNTGRNGYAERSLDLIAATGVTIDAAIIRRTQLAPTPRAWYAHYARCDWRQAKETAGRFQCSRSADPLPRPVVPERFSRSEWEAYMAEQARTAPPNSPVVGTLG